MNRADELLPPSEGSPLSQCWLAETALLCGDAERAKVTLARLEEAARTKYIDPTTMAGL
jgi:hypothetical protein